MPYSRVICSVPVFNINCGGPECVRELHALSVSTSEATRRSRDRLDSADYVPAIRNPIGEVKYVPPPVTTDTREACPPSSNSLFSSCGNESSMSGTGTEVALVRTEFNAHRPDLAEAEGTRSDVSTCLS